MILKTLESNPTDTCLISFDSLIKTNCIPYHVLREQWQLDLKAVPTIRSVEVKSRHAIDFKVRFNPEDERRAHIIWSRLQDLSIE